jgi:hypothetical protein
MRDFYVFDIPIYWCSKDTYEAKQDAAAEKQLIRCFESMGIPRESQRDNCDRIKGHAHEVFGGPWQFNQIVGWLRLFTEGNGLGGHLWMVNAKRMSRTMKKRFYLRSASNALSGFFPPNCANDEIFKITLESIEILARSDWLTSRYFDLNTFKRIGPFVEWRQLVLAGRS